MVFTTESQSKRQIHAYLSVGSKRCPPVCIKHVCITAAPPLAQGSLVVANVSVDSAESGVRPGGTTTVLVVFQPPTGSDGNITVTSEPDGWTCKQATFPAGASQVNTTCTVNPAAVAGNYTLRVLLETSVGQTAVAAVSIQVLPVGVSKPGHLCMHCLARNLRTNVTTVCEFAGVG